MLQNVVAVIGPPAVGKTTLTMRLAESDGIEIFRLREHVPDTILAATATSADRPGWIDDVTVARALRSYFEQVATDVSVCTILLDNFPGTGTQVRLLLGVLNRLSPVCVAHVVELVLDGKLREQRVLGRRVCHQCEQDPIHDPRIPAVAKEGDPRHCARCGGVLHPRRGDAPRLLKARTRRYEEQAIGIRAAYGEVGIQVMQLDSARRIEDLVADLSAVMAVRTTNRQDQNGA
jgi:adenylate kinase